MKQSTLLKQMLCLLIALFFTTSIFSNSGGVILDDQMICSGDTPTIILESSSPTIPGPFEYVWRQADPVNPTVWTTISGATNIYYTPPPSNVPTLYSRLVRTAGTSDNYVGSNTVLVDVAPLPTANIISVVPGTNPTVSTLMLVDAATDADPNSTYVWDFDDGFTCVGQSCSHIYAPTGNLTTTYNLCLTVTNESNCSATTCQTVTVFDPVLPIDLMYFEGYQDDQFDVVLKWATSSETNNSHFIIERSQDGFDFAELGRVEGNGNNSTIQYYNFKDENPFNGINYYRLKQVDFDGRFEYFEIISINSDQLDSQVNVFPNPASERINIRLNENYSSNPNIVLYDATGKVVKLIEFQDANSLNLETSFEINDLENGLYFLNIFENGKSIHTQKISILKN